MPRWAGRGPPGLGDMAGRADATMGLVVSAFVTLLCLTAVLAWVNERFVRIPTTVGVTLAGALSSLLVLGLEALGISVGLKARAQEMLQTLDFTAFVLNGILSVLLFAGALSLDARRLLHQRAGIFTLATAGTIVSAVVAGAGAWAAFRVVGLELPFAWALLFGALISPTDPVAVLDMLRRVNAPPRLKTLIAGESLFNDGVGVVLFVAFAGLAGVDAGGHVGAGLGGALLVFAREAVGGVAFGAALGWLGYRMCRSIDGHIVEIVITLALVAGGYLAADTLGVSGPLAMVVAGLVVSAGKEEAFDPVTREQLEGFWETLEQVLTVLLFAFIGFDVLLTETFGPQVLASVLIIGVALLARAASVIVPIRLVRHRDGYGPGTIRLLVWGGLRGGIAISLALGLPPSPYRAHLVTATYAVVLFSIAVQGLTVMPLVRRAAAADPETAAPHGT
ncbi:MAG: sodium:proton antiporter [Dermatophilaceae bacterium]